MTNLVDLERIITFSCGIGTSLNEAEEASKESKKRKKGLDPSNYHNYSIYLGVPIPDTFEEEPKVRSFNFIKDTLKGNPEALERLESLKYDTRTGLLNRMGMLIELANRPEDKGYFIFLDGDDMGGWNDRIGYEKVNNLFGIIGSAIKKSTREKDRRVKQDGKVEDRRKKDRRKESYLDMIGWRVHDSGGDEFVVYIDLERNSENRKLVEEITKRIIDNVYKSQLKHIKYKN